MQTWKQPTTTRVKHVGEQELVKQVLLNAGNKDNKKQNISSTVMSGVTCSPSGVATCSTLSPQSDVDKTAADKAAVGHACALMSDLRAQPVTEKNPEAGEKQFKQH